MAANGFLLTIYNYVTAMEFILMYTVGYVFTSVLFGRLSGINQLLQKLEATVRKCPTDGAPYMALTRFYRLHTECLLDVFEANQMYGYMLICFMAFAIPTSAYELILLLTGKNLTFLAAVTYGVNILYEVWSFLNF